MTTQKTLPKNCRFIYADATEYTTAESFYARAQIAVLRTMSANEILQAFMEGEKS